MGTHPIFESDFDCLTDMVGYTERDIDDLTNIYINQVVYPEELLDEDQNDGNENPMSKTNILEMPKSIYVTTLPTDVFKADELKTEFENLFQNAKFYYFPNFNRCRVEFEDSVEACRARIRFHLFNFHGNRLRVFLTNHSCCDNPETETEFLKPPKLEKQFLISPPASPPEGWQPIKEDGPSSEQPGLHFELVARLAALNGGQSHEIIEPSTTTPAIILHACEVCKNELMNHSIISDSGSKSRKNTKAAFRANSATRLQLIIVTSKIKISSYSKQDFIRFLFFFLLHL